MCVPVLLLTHSCRSASELLSEDVTVDGEEECGDQTWNELSLMSTLYEVNCNLQYEVLPFLLEIIWDFF